MSRPDGGPSAPTTDYTHCPKCGGTLVAQRPANDHRERQVCRACAFVFYQGPKVAAGTLPVVDGRVVLVRRGIPPGLGQWSFPCGYVEIDETVEEGARRETHEETGLEVRLVRLLGAYSYPPTVDRNRVAVLAYLAEVVGGRLAAGDDATDARYFPYDEIPWPDLAFKSTLEAIRDWRAVAAPTPLAAPDHADRPLGSFVLPPSEAVAKGSGRATPGGGGG
ncbi:MAG: NUDIX hydrolase, partial [Planctomycetes bacterium]|nr:NUDIX hydrolase [Planctomycetota bacterium]